MGSSCAVADPALSNALDNRAETLCWNAGHDLGACNIVHQITTGCYFNGTMFQTDGYVTNGCWVEVCIDPIYPY